MTVLHNDIGNGYITMITKMVVTSLYFVEKNNQVKVKLLYYIWAGAYYCLNQLQAFCNYLQLCFMRR